MAPELLDTPTVYGNIADEIKQRLRFIRRALLIPMADRSLDYIAVSDFCCLQFRKVFEAIALGCLLIHEDAPGTQRLKKDVYRADKLLSGLEKLGPKFFPVPCRVQIGPDGRRRIESAVAGVWLTKEKLQKTYHRLDHEMHVGTLSRRKTAMYPVTRPSFETLLGLTTALIQNHFVSFPNGDMRLVAELNHHGMSPSITVYQRRPHASPDATDILEE